MSVFLHLSISFVGLILIAAAFMYFFNPGEAHKLLQRLLLVLLGLVVSLDLLAQLADKLGAFGTGVFLLFLSLAAHWVREYRLRPPKRREKLGRAERKPILPGGG